MNTLSFSSEQIKDYFEGSDDYIPSRELLYINSHPLVSPNFIEELEVFINETAEYMVAKSISGKPVDKFTNLAISLGKLLPELTESNAAEALSIMRKIYALCSKITGKRLPQEG